MLKFLIFTSLLCVIRCNVPAGRFRIENQADHLQITTEGANSAFVKVVGENWQNFGEQKWNVKKSGPGGISYNLMPAKHTTNNVISFYKDPAKKHALPEQWNLLDVGRSLVQIQNKRTGLCLISSGRRKEIVEGKCDKYLPDRHWRFVPV